MEQPELGAALVAADSITVALEYRWESGWRLSYAVRSSGGEHWQRCTQEGLDAAEAHAALSDLLACSLGLA
jgi:hypothetical protein